MKKAIVFLMFLVPITLFAQYNSMFLSEYYFHRQHSARAEAMGGSLTTAENDISAIFYNPTATSSLDGLQVAGSYSSPFYLIDDANYNFVGAGYQFNKYFTVGFSRYYFTYEDIYLVDHEGNFTGESVKPYDENYTLNVSSEPIKDFFIGINVNYLNWQYIRVSDKAFYLDFGLLKKFRLASGVNNNHQINLAGSITNFSYSGLKADYESQSVEYELPVITRFGVNYTFGTGNRSEPDSLETFKAIVAADFNSVLNSAYLNSIHTGVEMHFFEFIMLRLGYYDRFVDDHGYPEVNKDHISQYTWGLGLNVPLHKLTKVPIQFGLDYTSLPQPSYSKLTNDLDNFTTWSAAVSWIL